MAFSRPIPIIRNQEKLKQVRCCQSDSVVGRILCARMLHRSITVTFDVLELYLRFQFSDLLFTSTPLNNEGKHF